MNNSLLQTPRKQLWIILAIVFFGFLGLAMPYLIFPSLFLNPRHTIIPLDWGEKSRSLFLGVTLAAYPLGQFIGSPILGALSDDYGRRKIMSGSLCIAACSTLLTALSIEGKMLWMLIASRFVAGLMEGNLAIARSMVVDMKELNKHETFGKINAVTSVAYIWGPVLGGFLADDSLYPGFSLSMPFYIMCALFLSLALSTFFLISEKPLLVSPTPIRTPLERINFVKRLYFLFNNKKLRFYLIIVSIHTLAADIFYEFGPVFLTLKWMLTPSELAIYNGLLCIGLTIGGFLTAILSKKFTDQKVVSWSMLAFVFAIAAIIFVDQRLYMFILFFLIGIALAVATTYLTVQVSDAAPEKIQGEVMGVQTSLRVLGDAVICLLGGLVLLFSCRMVLGAAAMISLTTVFYLIRSKATEELSLLDRS